MSRKIFLNTLLVLFTTVLFSQPAQARIKYGLWEITINVHPDGMPVNTPEEKIKQCITRKNLTPGDNKDTKGCKDNKVTRKDDTVSWTVNCSKDNHTMKGSGVVVYNNRTMTGHGQFQAGGKGLATTKIKLTYKGKYIGRCKK